MKKNNYIKISKLRAVDNALFKPADKKEFRYGEVNDNVSLPVDYFCEGHLIYDVKVGNPLILDRTSRNGVKTPGLMTTSKVTKIEKDLVYTLNSVYKIETVDAVEEAGDCCHGNCSKK